MNHRGKKSRAVLLAIIGAAALTQGAKLSHVRHNLAQSRENALPAANTGVVGPVVVAPVTKPGDAPIVDLGRRDAPQNGGKADNVKTDKRKRSHSRRSYSKKSCSPKSCRSYSSDRSKQCRSRSNRSK